MKKKTGLFLSTLLVAPAFSGAMSVTADEHDNGNSEPNWQMTWNDEFDEGSLDEDKWRIDIGNGFYDGDEWIEGWGNNESQSYQRDNVFVEDGKLVLEAREETVSDDKGTYDYTSGKVLTDESFSQAYGRFEASMKLPEGQGYWPAFWMMPQDDVYGGWAASGEIDIMENRGAETDKVGAAIHYGDMWPDNTYSEQSYTFPEGESTTDFNEYAIEWEPGEIRWYVNDELYSTKTEWSTAYGAYPAPFDQEFFMILNLAVGGWYGGEPDETTEFPGRVEVDYVRVYEDADAEHPPPGEYIEPDEDDGPEIVDPDRDWVEVGENLVTDGTFDETTEFGDEVDGLVWNVFNMADHDPNGGTADFDIVDGELKATVQQLGWMPWHIQFMQDVTVDAGIYKIEFDMRSDVDRDIIVELADSDSGLNHVSVTEDMDTHTAYISVRESGDYNLMFQLAHADGDDDYEVPYDMYLDNVRLVEVEDASAPAYDWQDLNDNHWAFETIHQLADLGIVTGFSEQEFRPEAQVTRAQYVTMIARALDLDASDHSAFDDVSGEAWYNAYVAAAHEAGIISGVTDTAFHPDAPITREQMAAVAYRAHLYVGGEEAEGDADGFTDADSISPWATEYVNAAQELGLIQGHNSGAFDPQGHATRAQSSQLVSNLLHMQ